MNSRAIGQQAEQLACEYLTKQGLDFITSNVNFPFGEIDLIMRDAKVMVFVEVRYRISPAFGSALESITQQKQQRISKAAQAYLQQQRLWQRIDCRFDVVTLCGKLEQPQIEWFKNLW